MLYSTLFVALLAVGAAAKPTNPHCPDGVCGGVCGDG